MKLRIDLLVGGLEALATGKEIYSWHFTAKDPTNEFWGMPTKGSVTIGYADVTLPEPETGIAAVLETIAARELELRQQLNTDLAELEQRRSNLLAIALSPVDDKGGL